MDCLAYEKEEQAHIHYWQKHVARAPKEIPQGIPPHHYRVRSEPRRVGKRSQL